MDWRCNCGKMYASTSLYDVCLYYTPCPLHGMKIINKKAEWEGYKPITVDRVSCTPFDLSQL